MALVHAEPVLGGARGEVWHDRRHYLIRVENFEKIITLVEAFDAERQASHYCVIAGPKHPVWHRRVEANEARAAIMGDDDA